MIRGCVIHRLFIQVCTCIRLSTDICIFTAKSIPNDTFVDTDHWFEGSKFYNRDLTALPLARDVWSSLYSSKGASYHCEIGGAAKEVISWFITALRIHCVKSLEFMIYSSSFSWRQQYVRIYFQVGPYFLLMSRSKRTSLPTWANETQNFPILSKFSHDLSKQFLWFFSIFVDPWEEGG